LRKVPTRPSAFEVAVAAGADDCILTRSTSNGWHTTDDAVPAALPARREFRIANIELPPVDFVVELSFDSFSFDDEVSTFFITVVDTNGNAKVE